MGPFLKLKLCVFVCVCTSTHFDSFCPSQPVKHLEAALGQMLWKDLGSCSRWVSQQQLGGLGQQGGDPG